MIRDKFKEKIPISNQWHVVPQIVINYKKYKGRGRPRKSDYKIFSEKDIFKKLAKWSEVQYSKNTKYIISSKGA